LIPVRDGATPPPTTECEYNEAKSDPLVHHWLKTNVEKLGEQDNRRHNDSRRKQQSTTEKRNNNAKRSLMTLLDVDIWSGTSEHRGSSSPWMHWLLPMLQGEREMRSIN
jgi:hypothetical protein